MQSFGFLFIEPHPGSEAPSAGHVYLKASDPETYGTTQQDRRLLTCRSTTWSEFSKELDRLHRELEEIRREAQLRFADFTARRYRMTGFTHVPVRRRER